MGLVVRTIGIARAKAAVTLANMAYNMKRQVWWEAKAKPHSQTPVEERSASSMASESTQPTA